MFLQKTFSKVVAYSLSAAMALTALPATLISSAATDPNKADMNFKLYQYVEPAAGGDLGSLGAEIDTSTGTGTILPGQKFVVKASIDKFTKSFGFAGLSYSFFYDPNRVELMTSNTDVDPGTSTDPTDFNEFQQKVFNTFNTAGKFNSTNYEMIMLESPVDNTYWDNVPVEQESMREIFINGLYKIKQGDTLPTQQVFTGSTTDNAIGYFLFKAKDPQASSTAPNAFAMNESSSSVDFAWYNSADPADSEYIIKGGQGDADFDSKFNPPTFPEINIPDVGNIQSIKPVSPVNTSADDPKLSSVSDALGVKVLLPERVTVVYKDKTEGTIPAEWIIDTGSEDFNKKGANYKFKTNIAGTTVQLSGVDVQVSPVYAYYPDDLKSQTILVDPAKKPATFQELLTRFPNSTGLVRYEGSYFGLISGPSYTVAWDPNALPDGWVDAGKGDKFAYKGTITTATPIPDYITHNLPSAVDITVLIDDLEGGGVIDPESIPKNPDGTFGFTTSADDNRLVGISDLNGLINAFLPKLVVIGTGNPDDGTFVPTGSVPANWTAKTGTDSTFDPKGKTYSVTTSIDEVKVQADATINITVVTGKLPFDTAQELYFGKNSMASITTFADLLEYFPKSDNLHLNGGKPSTRVPFIVKDWIPDELPADWTSATAKGAENYAASIDLTAPIWLTGSIPNTIQVDITYDRAGELTLVDPKDQTAATSADDNRINNATSLNTINKLLPQKIKANNGTSDVWISLNWAAKSEADAFINLKGKTYNFVSSIKDLAAGQNQVNGTVEVTAVTGTPQPDYKDYVNNDAFKVPLGAITKPEDVFAYLIKGGYFTLKGNIIGTIAKYDIRWDLSKLPTDFTTAQTLTVTGNLDHLDANWLTYTPKQITIELVLSELLNDGNLAVNGTDMLVYEKRGFRDAGFSVLDANGSPNFIGTFSVTRTSSKESTTPDQYTKIKDLPRYSINEDISLDADGNNNVGNYSVEYEAVVNGKILPAQSREVFVYYLRGDINKDGIINGDSNSQDKATDMGLFNLIIKRKEKYDNASGDADYIANLTNVSGTYSPTISLTSVFKVHNQEKLDKQIKGIPNAVPQITDFLIPGETLYTNRAPDTANP